MRQLHARERGFSTIEIMIAGGLVAFLAVALLPAVFSLLEGSKISAFRALCTATARAKLNEYLNGVPKVVSGAVTYVPSGFEYTKARYQDLADIPGNSICEIDSATFLPRSPGRRERVASNEIVPDTAGQEYATSASRVGISPAFTGFQLYVNIRHVNPRQVENGQPVRRCPDGNYQFFRSGDALEVEVTGMIRTSPTIANGGRNGGHYGNLTDDASGNPHKLLTCSLSQIVRPQAFPFRYFLGSDGKVRSYQATLAFQNKAPNVVKESTVAHFRSIWAQGGPGGTFDTPGLGNIRSFVVAPDNLSVYIMRPGLISRYSNCSDQTVTIDGQPFRGIPDCSLTTGRTEWEVDPNIESIAVDFQSGATDPSETVSFSSDDKIYGLYNTGGNSTNDGVSSLKRGEIRYLNTTTRIWQEDDTYSVPANRPRIMGIFMAPLVPYAAGLFPTLFYFDNTCYRTNATFGDSDISTKNTTYCATIFNSGDVGQSLEVRELPMQVEALSL